MRGWRPSRKHASLLQLNLPGLFNPENTGNGSHKNHGTYTRGFAPGERPASPHDVALDRARLRLLSMLLLFGIIYVLIAGRLADLTLLNDAPELPSAPPVVSELEGMTRADIVDRNGAILATSLPLFSLCANAHNILEPEEAARKLLKILPDLDNKRLAEDLRGAKHCALIRRHLTPRQYYAINRLGIAGLEFSPDEGRSYPSGAITAHVLGFTDIDNNGIAGLEKNLNARLEQQPEPVTLALDLRVQTLLRNALNDALQEYQAVGASGLIMDTTNGELLALVSLPDFDPLHAGGASDDAKFNRATLGVYEMGSTFKIINTALALDSGLIKPGQRFDTTHALEVGGRKIRDFHPATHPLNVAEIFMESSNIGSALMAEKVGSVRQRAFLERLGLLEKTALELPEMGAPLAPSAANWGDAATMTIAFGHGIAVNAIQLANAVATLVNNGIPVHATLLKNKPQNGKDKDKTPIISAHTSAQIRAMMRLTVRYGTGKQADVEGYLVGGKTGTANKLKGKSYSETARLSSFIGVFPIHAPRYLVMAVLDDPKGNARTRGFATGGLTAAPVVNKVISQIGPLLGMPPEDTEQAAAHERQLLHTLGQDVLDSLLVNKEVDKEDYAAFESDNAQ